MATLFTTSNIVLNSVLHDNNIDGFRLTDFLPVGIPVVIAGIAYIALFGRQFAARRFAARADAGTQRGAANDLIDDLPPRRKTFSGEGARKLVPDRQDARGMHAARGF